MTATVSETEQGTDEFTAFTRHVVRINLAIAALVHALTGLGLLWLSTTPSSEIVRVFIEGGVLVTTEATLLELGPTIGTIASLTPIVGVGFLALAAVTVRSLRFVQTGESWRQSILTAVAGLVNPLALPPSLVSVVLLGLVRDQFD